MGNTAVKCGGAVANLGKTSLDVGTVRTSLRMKMRMRRTRRRMTVTTRMTSMCDVHVARK